MIHTFNTYFQMLSVRKVALSVITQTKENNSEPNGLIFIKVRYNLIHSLADTGPISDIHIRSEQT